MNITEVLGIPGFFVAFLSLYFSNIRELWRTPRLTLNLRATRGWHTKPRGTDPTTGLIVEFPALYYYLDVKNAHKRIPAAHVDVRVIEIRRLDNEQNFTLESLPFPLTLAWPFPQFRIKPTTIVTDVTCDFGHISKLENCFQLEFFPPPTTPPGVVRANETVRVVVVAEGSNCPRSEPLTLEITWDGHWSEDPAEMQNHLKIRDKSLD